MGLRSGLREIQTGENVYARGNYSDRKWKTS